MDHVDGGVPGAHAQIEKNWLLTGREPFWYNVSREQQKVL